MARAVEELSPERLRSSFRDALHGSFSFLGDARAHRAGEGDQGRQIGRIRCVPMPRAEPRDRTMAYLRCPNCGLTMFDRNPLTSPRHCPRCARRNGASIELERTRGSGSPPPPRGCPVRPAECCARCLDSLRITVCQSLVGWPGDLAPTTIEGDHGNRIALVLSAILIVGLLVDLTTSAACAGPAAAKKKKKGARRDAQGDRQEEERQEEEEVRGEDDDAGARSTTALTISPASFAYPDVQHGTCSAPPDADCTLQTLHRHQHAAEQLRAGSRRLSTSRRTTRSPGDPPGSASSAERLSRSAPAPAGTCAVTVYFRPTSDASASSPIRRCSTLRGDARRSAMRRRRSPGTGIGTRARSGRARESAPPAVCGAERSNCRQRPGSQRDRRDVEEDVGPRDPARGVARGKRGARRGRGPVPGADRGAVDL